MWKKYENEEDKSFGFVRMISDDYSQWKENAEVILVDHFPSEKTLVTRQMIRFTEFFEGDKVEESFRELQEEYRDRYGKEPEDISDVAYYCADGYSRWNADERLEDPSEKELHDFLNKHGIQI